MLFRPIALVAVVGSQWLPADALCATEAPESARPASALAASSPAGAQRRISPYALAAKRQAEAASAAGHAPVVSPSMRRTRGAISRVPPQ